MHAAGLKTSKTAAFYRVMYQAIAANLIQPLHGIKSKTRSYRLPLLRAVSESGVYVTLLPA